jgi:hypothetical protein
MNSDEIKTVLLDMIEQIVPPVDSIDGTDRVARMLTIKIFDMAIDALCKASNREGLLDAIERLKNEKEKENE